MKFDVITIFPSIFDSYFKESIIKRARAANLIEINIHNLRDYTKDKHKKVDDTPYGGGAGMVMQVEPIYNALEDIKSKSSPIKLQENANSKTENSRQGSRVILFSAKGRKYTQADAKRLAQYDNLIFICGRYEGVDERVAQYLIDEEISIGDYVLTGGEIPAMVLVDSISRLIPGVLGNTDSLRDESFNEIENRKSPFENYLEYPQYTKPEEFNGWKVPEVLLSGNHEEIKKWRENKSKTAD